MDQLVISDQGISAGFLLQAALGSRQSMDK